MIVYRPATRAVDAADVLDLAVFTSHTERRRFLIHFGELEAALIDQGCDVAMEDHLRQVSLMAGKMFCSPHAAIARRLRQSLEKLSLPAQPISVSVPEGYAYYGLFPETYAQSAVEMFQAKRPQNVVCIGIRGIGTSLSAVVTATLEQLGCRVYSWTVRPQGHPYNRELVLSSATETAWRALSDATFAIVDEGPGRSGSTFTSVAEKISELGVSDDRICFLPSWNACGDEFVSETARRRWSRHARYTSEPPAPCGTDVSAGKWRTLAYKDEGEFPIVQTQHEARKYLSRTPAGLVLRKFAGLGVYGERKLHIARQLADAGFSPPVLGLEDGYLVTRFVPGKQLCLDKVNRDLLDTMARYLVFRRDAFQRDDTLSIAELYRMIEFNSGMRISPRSPDRPCLVDGRMLPHEWIATGTGYIKVDSLDHGDNHFFPGPTDIAWDLAGAIVEFRLQQDEKDYLVDSYATLCSDSNIRERLPFYTAAYIAFRLGYMSMNGFNEAAAMYREMLSGKECVTQ